MLRRCLTERWKSFIVHFQMRALSSCSRLEASQESGPGNYGETGCRNNSLLSDDRFERLPELSFWVARASRGRACEKICGAGVTSVSGYR